MEKIKIGKIYNTRGLKGELKVKPLTDFISDRFKKDNTLYIKDHSEYKEMTVKNYKDYKNGNILVVFKDYEDINLVEKYKGLDIYINSDNRKALNEGEVYIDELIGLKVFNEQHELIGEVQEVMQTGANSVLRINDKILIPFVDAFIKIVDLDKKEIMIQTIEGLL